ncbi:hypothetical protein [Leisingera thetidis]|uniref:hypothetical protein n=1 Tax=Leisingera thetidis TaxID=2930199 RepID=UPI0021F7CC3B|nr:hypothetical protein [Leisingera thetidis]
MRLHQEEAAFYQQASAAEADLETRKPTDRLKNLLGNARLIETSADMAKALANLQKPADPHQNRLMFLFANENGGLTFAFPPPPAAVRTGGGNGAVAFSDGASLAITAGSGKMTVQT